jgi:hypothetical protein
VTKLLLIATLFGALADRIAASHSAPPLLIDSPHSAVVR